MPKVLLHNLTIQHKHYDPAMFNFDQNAVFFAEKGDIVVTREKIPREYLVFLEKIGLDISGFKFVSSGAQLDGPTAIFEDRDVIANVRGRLGQDGKQWKLDSYMLTDREAVWASKVGLSFEGNPSDYYFFENKSAFRNLAKKQGLSTPLGFENLQGFLDGTTAVSILFLRGASEIVIKQDEGAAGLGSLRITKNQFFRRFFRPGQLFPGKLGWGIIPTSSPNFVAEVWHQNAILSPSVQFYIHRSGECETISMHCQLFGDNKISYQGCLSRHWIPQDIKVRLENEATAFARVLASKGVRCNLSFNAILLDDGRIFWTETNVRRVSSSYPHQIVKRILGKDAAEFPYISRRLKKESWKTSSVKRLMLELSPTLFSPRSKRGIIPWDFSRLNSQGEIYVLALGQSQDEALSLFNDVAKS